MSNSSSDDFITKKEVEHLFGRSHRSLTRDFSTAVKVGDADVLQNLEVRTDDNKVRSGTEVTLDLIQELSNKGLSPTWFVRRTWAQRHYGDRANPPRSEDKTKPQTTPHTPEPVDSTNNDSEIISILKDQLRRSQEEHQKDKEAFREQSMMFKQMFDTLKDDHADTKSLLREVHKVFGNVSQSVLQSSPRSSKLENDLGSHPEREQPPHEETATQRATIDVQPAEMATSSKRRSPSRSTATRKKKPSKTRSATTKKKTPVADSPIQTSWSAKHLPTFKRFFASK